MLSTCLAWMVFFFKYVNSCFLQCKLLNCCVLVTWQCARLTKFPCLHGALPSVAWNNCRAVRLRCWGEQVLSGAMLCIIYYIITASSHGHSQDVLHASPRKPHCNLNRLSLCLMLAVEQVCSLYHPYVLCLRHTGHTMMCISISSRSGIRACSAIAHHVLQPIVQENYT